MTTFIQPQAHIKISIQKRSNYVNFTQYRRNARPFFRQPYALFRKSGADKSSDGSVNSAQEDFVSRVLKQNPSQVEPKFLIGDKFYSLEERLHLKKEKGDDVFEVKERREDGKRVDFGDVKLKDMLRDFRGKLYVPEQVFEEQLSEEEEFDRSFLLLPKIEFKEFEKAMRTDKIKLLTFKDDISNQEHYDFILEFKEIPGIKSLHRTKWAMKLDRDMAQAVFNEYKGPRYKIEKQLRAWVAKLPEYPHPVASSITGRVIVELGVLTAGIAVAAAVIGGFLASAVYVVTSFLFAVAVNYIWPIFKPFVLSLSSLLYNVLEIIGENIVDMFTDVFTTQRIRTKLSEIFIFSGVFASLPLLTLIMGVLLTMCFILRYTISRRPKDFKRWDIWQGMEFSQSKAQARVDGSTGVTFKDVAGIDSAVEELQELVRYLKNPELFEKMGIKPPHGVLLEGPPGCGKTLVAKAIAGEAGVPFYQMAGSEFVEILVGVGSARIRDLFKRAKVNKPSVIFIDEIDALATRRQGILRKAKNYTYNAATQERETTLNQLLIELDGFDTGKGVIFLGATNRKDLLDPALLRPGRFDRKVRIHPPNAKGRLEIMKIHARKVKLSDSVDLSSYAQDLPGWTGARLAQLLQEAALVAVRKGHKSIIKSDLDEAIDRLTVGPKRTGLYLDYQGQCRRAITEAGTAITSHLLRQIENANIEQCDRISIHPRGQNFSQIVFHRLDDESLVFERRPQLLHRLQMLLGGRAAEEVIFGRDTSDASVKYLGHASWLARKIISGWNLENPMAIHGESPPWVEISEFVGPRLDFEGSLYKLDGLYAQPLNFYMDDEIARRTEELMHNMYEKTVTLLKQHNAALLKTVKVLLNQMEISGQEIDFVLEHYPPNTPASLILEEGDPGGLPLFHKQNQEQGQDLEYDLLTQ